MAWMLSCRKLQGGGPVCPVSLATNPPDQFGAAEAQAVAACRGKDVLIATHGFNVNGQEGTEHLTLWQALIGGLLPGNAVYLGYLWPGDSVWLHAMVYPAAAKVAMDSGDQLAAWVNAKLGAAASVSFVSHSLGARVVLQAIKGITAVKVRRLLLMAGAVDDTALGAEYAAAAAQVAKISNLSSQEDDVLKWAFPLGNPLSGIFAEGHPFWHAAIGRDGPSQKPPAPAQLDVVCQVPNAWDFGHDDYLPPSPAKADYVSLAYGLPVNAPATQDAPAAGTPAGYWVAGVLTPYWKSGWTAGFEAARFP